ncbi:MAG: tRNA(Ile)-lysidine synthetase [Thermoleophilia bacterium]|nr:tRNA(Ile)-lysidine synthetase [Thermoleophilia bacterium]
MPPSLPTDPALAGRAGTVRRVRRLLDDSGASLTGRRVLALCSGGIDSVVLVSVLSQLPRGAAPRELTVLWLDHALRADVSAERAAAEAAAHHAGAVFFERRADVSLALGAGGTEAAARAWRYEQAAALAAELECSVVATGHTASDQLECALLALAGVTGSGEVDAMPVARPLAPGVQLVRPLLSISRSEVEDYAREAGLGAAEDPTNAQPEAHVRNAIRHHVVPPLLAAHPGAGAAIVRAATRARGEREASVALADALLQAWGVVTPGGPVTHLDVRALAPLPAGARRELLARWLVAIGLGRDLSTRIVDAVDGLATLPDGAPTASVDLPRGACVRRDGYHLALVPSHPTHERPPSP